MLSTLDHLTDSTVTATDGAIGHVTSAYFDDQSWAIRYLVVDTGAWLPGRQVLVSPYAVRQPLGTGANIDVALTRKQVEGGPDIDTHQPVSRRHEREYLSYFAYPQYWGGGGLWELGGFPMVPPYLPTFAYVAAANVPPHDDTAPEDVHLRSSNEVTGYEIHAADGSIGHVDDFVFDDESWAIRYLVIDTRNWLPGGRKVLVALHWVDRIDWATSTVHVGLTRDQVRHSPERDEAEMIERGHEQRLHDAYERKGYWS